MGTTTARTYNSPIDWLFRSRSTGRITIVQLPNLPLWLFIASAVVRMAFHPGGRPGLILDLASAALLLAWAALEIARGVNPFRRALGAVVGISQLLMLVRLV